MDQHTRTYRIDVLPNSTKAWAVDGAGLRVVPVTIQGFHINLCRFNGTATVVYTYDLDELNRHGHRYPDPWHELYLSKDGAEKRRMEKYAMLGHWVEHMMERYGK